MDPDLETTMPESAAIVNALDELKHQGSNILLVGESGSIPHATACKRLLGEPSDGTRHRLYVATDELDYSKICDADDSGRMHIIEYTKSDDERRETDANGETASSQLGATSIELVEIIDEIAAESDSLDPSSLRVCVDSLLPLIAENEPEAVFRFVHMTTARIKQTAGIGHYHLPVDRSHDIVSLFEPLFDATIEVRSHDGEPQQRWHFRDHGPSSSWLSL